MKKLNNDAVQSATDVNLQGQYVLIVLHGDDEYLNLAEVEVYGEAISATSPQRARIDTLGQLSTDDIIVSPNPSNGYFEVYVGGLMGSALQISVYDTTGKQVHDAFLSNGHWYYHDIDLVHLPSGTYTLVVTNAEGETFTKQMVIR